MRRIKNYEDFTNEEINWKKGVATAALGASLLGGMQSCQTDDELFRARVQQYGFSDDEISNMRKHFNFKLSPDDLVVKWIKSDDESSWYSLEAEGDGWCVIKDNQTGDLEYYDSEFPDQMDPSNNFGASWHP